MLASPISVEFVLDLPFWEQVLLSIDKMIYFVIRLTLTVIFVEACCAGFAIESGLEGGLFAGSLSDCGLMSDAVFT